MVWEAACFLVVRQIAPAVGVSEESEVAEASVCITEVHTGSHVHGHVSMTLGLSTYTAHGETYS